MLVPVLGDVAHAHKGQPLADGHGGNVGAVDGELLIAVQPTRGLDVGAIEYIHKQLVAQRDAGKGVLLVSLELDEVMNVSDRILVMYEGARCRRSRPGGPGSSHP